MCLKAFVSIKKNRQIQSDWNQTDPNAVSFIKNKPDVALLNDAIGKLALEINTLRGKIPTIETNISNLQQAIANLQAKVSAIETNIGNMQNNIANLQGYCDAINGKVENQQLSINDLNDAMSTIPADIRDIKRRLTLLEGE